MSSEYQQLFDNSCVYCGSEKIERLGWNVRKEHPRGRLKRVEIWECLECEKRFIVASRTVLVAEREA
jgi:ribosomal protein L37AE/L43A